MVVVFDGLVHTAYAQLYLTTGSEEIPLPDVAFVGQSNGLAGAAEPGTLFLITGTHTGSIPVRVVVDDAPPEPGGWEEIVEVALVPAGTAAFLLGWASDPSATFDLPAPSYRARWSGSGMDAGHRADVATDEYPARDRYELALWPVPPSADAVVLRTGAQAAYWHDRGFDRG